MDDALSVLGMLVFSSAITTFILLKWMTKGPEVNDTKEIKR